MLLKVIRFLVSTVWTVWVEPLVIALGLYEPKDRSYGRSQVPFSSMEQRLHSDPDVKVSFHKVMLENGKDWVWYQIWQDPASIETTGRQADMIFVHGTGVHSGTFASQCRRYLDAGFRLIVPDLPSHGYSSGLHVYQRDLKSYCQGVRAVLHHVARRDDQELSPDTKVSKLERRKTFLLGLSFGGMVAYSYAAHFPSSFRYDEQDPDEIPIDGIVGVGPTVGYAIKHHRIAYWAVHVIDYLRFGSRLEIIVPHKKQVDNNPKVYDSLITLDPRSHRGALRAGHITCITSAIKELKKSPAKIRHPIYLQIGGKDRVASIPDSIEWMRNLTSTDKCYEVYPQCQHVIYRRSVEPQDDLAGRITVITDNIRWMCERSEPVERKSERLPWNDSESSSDADSSNSLLFDKEIVSNGDHDTVCSTVSSTPSLARSDSSWLDSKEERVDVPGSETLSPPSVLESSSLRQRKLSRETMGSATGWKEVDGQSRLFRSNWSFSEQSRPYQVYVGS